MKYRPLYIIFLLLNLALFSGCPKPRDPIVHEMDPDFLDYCAFPDNSYWVYEQDSAPGILDSVSIAMAKHEYWTNEKQNVQYEIYGYHYTIRGAEWYIEIRPYLNQEPNLFVLREMVLNTGQNSAFHLFKYEAGGDTLRDGHPGAYISARHPQITINGTTYTDAITVTHPTSYYGNPTRELTFVRDVGIVRRTFWDGTTWSLVRYHIP